MRKLLISLVLVAAACGTPERADRVTKQEPPAAPAPVTHPEVGVEVADDVPIVEPINPFVPYPADDDALPSGSPESSDVDAIEEWAETAVGPEAAAMWAEHTAAVTRQARGKVAAREVGADGLDELGVRWGGASAANAPGVTPRRERDTLLVSPVGAPHVTVMLRAVSRDGDWAHARGAERVMPAMLTWLESLPDANITLRRPLSKKGFTASEFVLSFRPEGGTERFDRRHVVLVGEHHVYHVVVTTPSGKLADGDAMFAQVLNILNEEV